jgi:hypothetical protein
MKTAREDIISYARASTDIDAGSDRRGEWLSTPATPQIFIE